MRRWILEGMHDAELRDDTGDEWVTIERSPFASLLSAHPQKDGNSGRLTLYVVGAGAAALASLVVLVWVILSQTSSSRLTADVNAAVSARSARHQSCLLAIPGSPNRVRGLPTWRPTADEPVAPAKIEQQRARFLEALAVSNEVHEIESGTRCTCTERGAVTSRVRVEAGPLRGKRLWVLSEWTRVTELDGG